MIEGIIKNLGINNIPKDLKEKEDLKFKNILDSFLEGADVIIRKEKIENNFDNLLDDLLGN